MLPAHNNQSYSIISKVIKYQSYSDFYILKPIQKSKQVLKGSITGLSSPSHLLARLVRQERSPPPHPGRREQNAPARYRYSSDKLSSAQPERQSYYTASQQSSPAANSLTNKVRPHCRCLNTRSTTPSPFPLLPPPPLKPTPAPTPSISSLTSGSISGVRSHFNATAHDVSRSSGGWKRPPRSVELSGHFPMPFRVRKHRVQID